MDETMADKIYPLTVIADRYDGVYSGGRFLAFNRRFYDIPEAIASDDVSCSEFWSIFKNRNEIVGLGDTPDEAIKNLYHKLKRGI